MFLDVMRDFWKLLNRKIVPLYLWLFLYCFNSSIEDNFFICSYLRDEVFGKDENTTLVILFYIVYSFILFYINKLRQKNVDNKSIALYTRDLLIELLTAKYKLYIIIHTSINHILLFINKKLILFNIFLLNNYKPYFINTLIIFLFNIYNSSTLIWYPIFKTYSIFGYYKSTRLNYIDLKNENIKRIKC